MPKDRRVQSLSFDRSRASPYPCSSSSRDAKQHKIEIPSGSPKDIREWEEVRCPICLDHPHNAVLLQCSSAEKGCQPYMCNTSYRHSNCLDQFLKKSASTSSTEILQEILPVSMSSPIIREGMSLPRQSSYDVRPLPKVSCPLCRGEIYGYIVVEAARQFMNGKVRSCSSENCEYSGTYSELRKHARSEHPSARPTEVDPERQHDWARLEHIRGFRDFLSIIQPMMGEEISGGIWPNVSYGTFLYVLLGSFLIYQVEEFLVTDGEHVHDNRSSRRHLRFRYNTETNHIPRHRYNAEANPAPAHRSMNEMRQGRTQGGRYYTETNRSHRWTDNLQAGRVNHSRYIVETNRSPRWNDNLRPQRTNYGQGLLWRGQRRSRFNNQR